MSSSTKPRRRIQPLLVSNSGKNDKSPTRCTGDIYIPHSFYQTPETINSIISTAAEQAVSTLRVLSHTHVDSFFKEVSSRLDERFDCVRATQMFRDLPQGSNYFE